jgi:hypothetical protein
VFTLLKTRATLELPAPTGSERREWALFHTKSVCTQVRHTAARGRAPDHDTYLKTAPTLSSETVDPFTGERREEEEIEKEIDWKPQRG